VFLPDDDVAIEIDGPTHIINISVMSELYDEAGTSAKSYRGVIQAVAVGGNNNYHGRFPQRRSAGAVAVEAASEARTLGEHGPHAEVAGGVHQGAHEQRDSRPALVVQQPPEDRARQTLLSTS